ncbi:MAG: TPM domain-containing protein [Chitinophagales bacterium]|nr:TPM domain-containing protein [Chitinophagales bacterium]
MPSSKNLLSAEEKDKIVLAIREAEEKTSGEIRVFFENYCRKNVLDRSIEIFQKMQMEKTENRTGVLIYVACKDQVFAILGDKGIHEKVPENFWDETKEIMQGHFQNNEFAEGLVKAITMSGEHLKKHFSRGPEDKNELSDEIDFGDDE